MTTFGVTPAGFVRKNFADIQASLFGYWRSKISKLLQLTEKTGLGNVGNGAAGQLAEAWEALEAAYYSNDPDNADDASQIALAALTGTIQQGARAGQCLCGVKLQAGTYPAGVLVANVQGQPSNRWHNRDTIVIASTSTTYQIFVSEIIGSGAVALMNTLSVIAQPYAGFKGILNDTQDAAPGLDVESIEALGLRRQVELQGSGSGPLAAVRAAVSKVPGVLSVQARQNVTNLSGLLPAKSYQIVIWDGVIPEAADVDVAQAIYGAGPAGIQSFGATTVNVVTGDDGLVETRSFTRAAQLAVYVTCTVKGTAAVADVQAAILAAGAKLSTGVTYSKLVAAATDVASVTDVISLTDGYTASPVGVVNLAVGFGQIALFDVSRILVTVIP